MLTAIEEGTSTPLVSHMNLAGDHMNQNARKLHDVNFVSKVVDLHIHHRRVKYYPKHRIEIKTEKVYIGN